MLAARWWFLVAAVAACKRDDTPAPSPGPAPTPAVPVVDAAAPLAPIEIIAGNPVLVATTREAWGDDLPSSEPLFALYDNGALLCVDKTGRHAAMLAPTERDELISALAVPALVRAAGQYQAIEATDQRYSNLYIWKAGCRARIYVWGDLLTADNEFTNDAKTSTIPALILFAWKRIHGYPCGKAAPWRFATVEAIVSLADDPGPNTATWPSTWPTVAHERVIWNEGDEGAESVIALPAEASVQLHAMYGRRVQIGARTHFVRDHVPWPHEDQWERPPSHACGPETRHY